MLVRTGFILSSRSVALGKNSDLIINVVVQLLYSHLLYLCIFSEVDCIYEKKNHFFIDQTRLVRTVQIGICSSSYQKYKTFAFCAYFDFE